MCVATSENIIYHSIRVLPYKYVAILLTDPDNFLIVPALKPKISYQKILWHSTITLQVSVALVILLPQFHLLIKEKFLFGAKKYRAHTALA